MRLACALGLAAAPVALGCSGLPAEVESGAVAERLQTRTALPVRAVGGEEEEPAVEAEVDALLARELSCDDAVRIALLNSRALRAGWARLAAASADVREASAFPELFLGVEVRFPDGGGKTELEFDLVQDLFGLLTRGARREIALSTFEQEVLALGAEVLELAHEVRHAWYDLVALQQEIAVQEELASAASAARLLAEAMRAAGNLSALGVSREESMEEAARLDLARSQRELVPLRERLNVLLGLWGERVDWAVPPHLPEIPAQDPAREGLETLAVERDPELAARNARLNAVARALGLVRGWHGFVELKGGLAANREDGGWSVGPVLDLGIPLTGQGRARVERLTAELAAADAELAQRAVEVRSAVRTAHDALLQSRRIAERYRTRVVPLRERIVRLAQEEYNYMLIGAFELLEDRRAQSEAYHGFVMAARDYWIARADLEHALAGPLPAGEAPPEPPAEAAPPTREPAPEPPAHYHQGGSSR
jgi:outer membrane protein TolC